MNSFFSRFFDLAWKRWFLASGLSFGMHLLVIQSKPSPTPPPAKKHKMIKFRLTRPRPRLQTPTPKRPKPRKPKPKKRKPKTFRKRRSPRRAPAPRNSIPPSNTKAKPTPDQPIPRPIFGVNLSSLAKNGGTKLAVRAGNTLMKEPEARITPPKKITPYTSPRTPPPPKPTFAPVPYYEVDQNPIIVKRSPGIYPQEALQMGVEARVILRIELRKNGKIRKIRCVSISPASSKGYQFEKQAIAAVKKFVFKPARYQGQPVDVVFRYTYKFKLGS